MIRLPLAPERIGAQVELTRGERHYLLDVLRLAEGGTLEVFDGFGGRYPATLLADGRLALGPRAEAPPAAAPVTLAQALARGEKMDLVVQKATELGASAIAPFQAERSIVRLDAARAAERAQRWQRIAAAAASQCGRADVPAVRPVAADLASVVAQARAEGALPLLLWEGERSTRFAEALAGAAGPVWIIAGPEGGFAAAEVAAAAAAGARSVTLGARVLRTETVALAALAVVQFLRGEFG